MLIELTHGRPGQSQPGRRIAGIDAARGFAMLLVCLSHAKHHFAAAPALYQSITTVTLAATPTFLLLSGIVIAHLLRSSREPHGTRIALVDRALFLLLAARVLLGLGELPELGVMGWLFGRAGIVDAIGVALIVAVLVYRASSAILLTAGLSLILLSWPVAMLLSVDSPSLQGLGSLLFNLRSERDGHAEAPLVAYIGLFLVGMGLSARFQNFLRERRTLELAQRFLIIGLSSIALAISAALAWRLVRDEAMVAIGSQDLIDFVRQMFNPRAKRPPSPTYFLFYAGSALTLTATMLLLEQFAGGRQRIGAVAVLGRASLMCFVVQDWLLRAAPAFLWPYLPDSMTFWGCYLALTIAVLYWLARKWDAMNGNRFLTVGLKAIARRRAPRRVGVAAAIPAMRAAPGKEAGEI